MGVYAACPLFQGDIRFFWNKELGIVAPILEVCDDAPCDFTIEFVFEEASVRTAFAGSVGAVTVVDGIFLCGDCFSTNLVPKDECS